MGPTHVQCDVEFAASSLTKSSIKSIFVSILLFHGNVIEIMYLDRGTWRGMIWMVTLPTHVRFNWPRQLTTLTIRPHRAHASCRWFSTRLQWLQCVSKGVTIVLHETNDAKWCALVRKMVRRVRRKTNFLWSYGDKYEKYCYALNWFICVWIFEKWLNGKGWYYCKLHFMLSCIIWKKKPKENKKKPVCAEGPWY